MGWYLVNHRDIFTFTSTVTGKSHAKFLISRTSPNRTEELVINLKYVTGLLKGHWHFKGCVYKLGLVDNSGCSSCLNFSETALHIPCYCESFVELRYRHLGAQLLNSI